MPWNISAGNKAHIRARVPMGAREFPAPVVPTAREQREPREQRAPIRRKRLLRAHNRPRLKRVKMLFVAQLKARVASSVIRKTFQPGAMP